MGKPLTIGQVARQAGVGVETVRFYERRGLVDVPPRKVSGYRQYPPEVVDRLRFIRRAKELGFTLVEVRELLTLRENDNSGCQEAKGRAEAKIAEIDSKIHMLQQMKKELAEVAQQCSGQGETSSCPILAVLNGEPTQ